MSDMSISNTRARDIRNSMSFTGGSDPQLQVGYLEENNTALTMGGMGSAVQGSVEDQQMQEVLLALGFTPEEIGKAQSSGMDLTTMLTQHFDLLEQQQQQAMQSPSPVTLPPGETTGYEDPSAPLPDAAPPGSTTGTATESIPPEFQAAFETAVSQLPPDQQAIFNDPEQQKALAEIVMRESGWDPEAQNPTSTAHGLFQFLSETASQYEGYDSGVEGQMAGGLAYILERYGSPQEALAFHDANGWY